MGRGGHRPSAGIYKGGGASTERNARPYILRFTLLSGTAPHEKTDRLAPARFLL
ncbi:hypothetical protein SAMN05192585_1091 [Acetanaerobacterium elongatum]|uniref:Uncharacterized protein n=1 Tax=Acetanaerobacterium elongatum TaxID=258515 RepID=A0A1G9XQ13_9FIRM|nr:hypothetical protein SAMN05192585_1091 [Acetanaerobacterium elongatum]